MPLDVREKKPPLTAHEATVWHRLGAALTSFGMKDADIARLRVEYEVTGLRRTDLHQNPFAQLDSWLEDADRAELPEVNVAVLSTATPEGAPSSRAVLLKQIDERGIVFYTNYESRKAIEMDTNPRVGLLFVWVSLHRQIRIEGRAERIPPAESDAYFASRPFGARIAAMVSPQSRIVPGRDWLEERFVELESEYADGGQVPRPDYWGGYRIVPQVFEFWQGRPNRLHDRFRYRPEGDAWILERLAP